MTTAERQEQRLEALRHGDAIRLERAQVMGALRATARTGQTGRGARARAHAAGLLEELTPALESLRLDRFLGAIPYLGAARRGDVLEAADLRPWQTARPLSRLTERQRTLMARELRR